jgi:hypothetical protein
LKKFNIFIFIFFFFLEFKFPSLDSLNIFSEEDKRENYAKAEQMLKYFGDQLELSNLSFDSSKTCILGIDDKFSLHITYESRSSYLYIYSPLFDTLPKDKRIRLELYRNLLTGMILGSGFLGGGISNI